MTLIGAQAVEACAEFGKLYAFQAVGYGDTARHCLRTVLIPAFSLHF